MLNDNNSSNYSNICNHIGNTRNEVDRRTEAVSTDWATAKSSLDKPIMQHTYWLYYAGGEPPVHSPEAGPGCFALE
jgi:hypothetical protein